MAEGVANRDRINGDLREEISQLPCADQRCVNGGKAQGIGLRGC